MSKDETYRNMDRTGNKSTEKNCGKARVIRGIFRIELPKGGHDGRMAMTPTGINDCEELDVEWGQFSS